MRSTRCPRSRRARASPIGGCCAGRSPTSCSPAGGRSPTSCSDATTSRTISPTSSARSTTTIAELGASGTTDVFALTRRIGHRVGLASWGGPGAADGPRFERLVAALDALDGADAFVHPDAMAAVVAHRQGGRTRRARPCHRGDRRRARRTAGRRRRPSALRAHRGGLGGRDRRGAHDRASPAT